MNFDSVPFVANTTPVIGGATYIRFATLTSMVETGDAGSGWVYTGQAGSAPWSIAGGSDWSLAPGVAGGFKVQFDYTLTPNGAPVMGVYTTTNGAWDSSYFQIIYGSDFGVSGPWNLQGPGFTNLNDAGVTRQANDWIKWEFDATDGYTVSVARAATPDTWTVVGSGTQTRAATLYPRLNSFTAAPDGAVYTAPQVLP